MDQNRLDSLPEALKLDNPVLLILTKLEEKISKSGDEILVMEFATQSEKENFVLAHILFVPHTRNSEQENTIRLDKLVRFCQAFGISINVPSETSSWVGRSGRANLLFSPDNTGKQVPRVESFVSRNFQGGKLTDENNWRGDRIKNE